jgi:hypothetical protein
VAQHAALTLDRWSRFTLDQQILMIANELNRASKWLGPGDETRRRSAYERALHADVASAPEPHAAVFRALLRFTPTASRQIPHVFPPGARR